jgi:hypothetical protein
LTKNVLGHILGGFFPTRPVTLFATEKRGKSRSRLEIVTPSFFCARGLKNYKITITSRRIEAAPRLQQSAFRASGIYSPGRRDIEILGPVKMNHLAPVNHLPWKENQVA